MPLPGQETYGEQILEIILVEYINWITDDYETPACKAIVSYGLSHLGVAKHENQCPACDCKQPEEPTTSTNTMKTEEPTASKSTMKTTHPKDTSHPVTSGTNTTENVNTERLHASTEKPSETGNSHAHGTIALWLCAITVLIVIMVVIYLGATRTRVGIRMYERLTSRNQ